MTKPIEPVRVEASEAANWSGRPSLRMWAAMAWNRRMPRYRAWGPRQIGRVCGRGMRVTIRTVSGGTVAADPGCLDIYTAAALAGGIWEPMIHDVCKAIVGPGQVLYDIGANAGIVSIDVAAHFKGTVRVVAFEPLPSLARHVALSARLSGLDRAVEVFEVMLGEARGEATLYLTPTVSMTSAVSRGNHVSTLKRDVVPLDDLVDSGAIPPPSAIKIGVEGSELRVFRGATGVLRTHRPTILFEADANLDRYGLHRRDLVKLLGELAPYRFFYPDRNGALRPATDLDVPPDPDHDNMLAVSQDRPMPPLPVMKD